VMIQQLDTDLFLFLNSINSPFWDDVMWIISARLTWVPLYLIILWMFFRLTGRRVILVTLFVIAAITLSDQLSVHAFKEVFLRLRPCHEPSLEGLVHIVRGKCGGQYGFVSSHAANCFNIAVFSLLLLRKRWFTVIILLWAALVSYSRVYLGVHYPGDIIGGALLGAGIGFAIYHSYIYILKNLVVFIPWFSKPNPQ
jgi:undecaprenyl-diphosphatase